jgi:hypothetical protein
LLKKVHYVLQDETAHKSANFTRKLPELPLQFGIGDSVWRTPDLPRNFFMTGYSPDTQDMDSLLTPPEPAATCDRLNDVRKEGLPIPPHMQRIVRDVAASQPRSGINHQTKVPAIVGTHPPNMDCKWDYASAQKKPP